MRLVAAAALTLFAVVVRVPQGAEADLSTFEHQVDEEETCEYDPASLAESALNDPGDERKLRVLVLLDGPTRRRAQEVVAEAGGAYTPLNITLTAGYRPVKLTGRDRDPNALIDEAKALLGGQVPHGYSAVHIFTTKDISGWGYAECIGGIRTRSYAFSVSEDAGNRAPLIAGPPYNIEMPWIWGPLTERVLAHELGHVMGGQHQLSNCVEGPLVGDVPRPCTLMDTSLAMTLKFSTANAAVVRAHAVTYLPATS